ncbi:hypothetical protein CBD41_06795 [bacterium TMED181]|nr:hypothetical protein [Planctomycetota bacterium]OUW43734.1 MAG: hypothetical protein CBD41_06795 [bacterium TMED181]
MGAGGEQGIGGQPGQLKPEQLPGGNSPAPGKIVSTFLTRGEAPAGEARREFSETVASSSRVAESEIEKQRLPAALKKVTRDYFDRLQGRTDD